jgi:hypothetical protein
MYRQCELRRGTTVQQAWIPEVFAQRGKYLQIEQQNGWRVASVGIRRSGEYLLDHERDHVGHRSRTDI